MSKSEKTKTHQFNSFAKRILPSYISKKITDYKQLEINYFEESQEELYLPLIPQQTESLMEYQLYLENMTKN